MPSLSAISPENQLKTAKFSSKSVKFWRPAGPPVKFRQIPSNSRQIPVKFRTPLGPLRQIPAARRHDRLPLQHLLGDSLLRRVDRRRRRQRTARDPHGSSFKRNRKPRHGRPDTVSDVTLIDVRAKSDADPLHVPWLFIVHQMRGMRPLQHRKPALYHGRPLLVQGRDPNEEGCVPKRAPVR